MGHSAAAVQRNGPVAGCGPEILFSSTAGKVGLRNLGNSCFMNAGLQCLCHLEPLVAYFLTGQYEKELNASNPMGRMGELAQAFAHLQRAVWQDEQLVLNPKELHGKLAQFAPHLFEGGEQQDVQEFLAFCLDGLHEDLKRVKRSVAPITDAQEKEDERLALERGEEFAGALAWFRHLEREKSFLVDLLQGQLRSSLTCLKCGHVARRFDPFLYLSLPVAKTMDSVTDALERFLEEERLTGDNQWRCPICKIAVDATKKIDLWKLPPVLVCHLKRFEFDAAAKTFRKSENRLTMKLSLLDLTPFCSSPQRDGAVYDVVCVANHSGAYGSGHYTASCRVGGSSGGEWHHFDDARISPLGGRSVVTRETYMIFLARHEIPSDKPTWLQRSSCALSRRGGASSSGARRRVLLRKQSVTAPEEWPYPSDLVNDVLDSVTFSSASAGGTFEGRPDVDVSVGIGGDAASGASSNGTTGVDGLEASREEAKANPTIESVGAGHGSEANHSAGLGSAAPALSIVSSTPAASAGAVVDRLVVATTSVLNGDVDGPIRPATSSALPRLAKRQKTLLEMFEPSGVRLPSNAPSK